MFLTKQITRQLLSILCHFQMLSLLLSVLSFFNIRNADGHIRTLQKACCENQNISKETLPLTFSL